MKQKAEIVRCQRCYMPLSEPEPYKVTPSTKGGGYDIQPGQVYYCPDCNTLQMEFEYDEVPAITPYEEVEMAIPEPPTLSFTLKDTMKVEIPILKKRAKLNQLKGDYSEHHTSFWHTMEGYDVVKLVNYAGAKNWVLNVDELKEVLEKHDRMDVFTDIASRQIAGLPDFLCINFEDLFFVESKATKEGFSPQQRIRIAELIHDGYKVYAWISRVQLDERFDPSAELYAIGVDPPQNSPTQRGTLDKLYISRTELDIYFQE